MKLYTNEAVSDFIEEMINSGDATITLLNEGCLLGGDYLVEKEGMKSVLITEKYLNEWSSAYIVRRFSSNNEKSMKRLNKIVDEISTEFVPLT